jgi:hypothetical protein
MTSAPVPLPRRLAAGFCGCALPSAAMTGPGIAAQRLPSSDAGPELLENAAAAGGLFAVIVMSGAAPRGHHMFGHKDAEIARRTGIAAHPICCGMTVGQVSDLDLFCTPPPGSPWDAVGAGAQAWTRQLRQEAATGR